MLTRKRKVLLNLKNICGWRTQRKFIIFAVDDYGNIRMANKKARDNLKSAGLKIDSNRFDLYDSLENEEDLIQLFDALTSVKDINGRNAIFTAFTNPANINFEKVRESNFSEYHYELLHDTFKKLPGYENVWSLWNQGINNNLLSPQFHGREHLNLKLFLERLDKKDPELIQCINNNSFGGLSKNLYKNISYTAAYDFEDFSDNERLKCILEDGLNVFEKVFNKKATHFNAPGSPSHHCLEGTLKKGGIKFIDENWIKKEHQGNGKYNIRFYYFGKSNNFKQYYLLRNCVFEPLLNSSNTSIESCLTEIEIAFKWHKPAVISSHRVNFSGNIDPKIRKNGISDLKNLLKHIIKRWPEVEFVSTNELGEFMLADLEFN